MKHFAAGLAFFGNLALVSPTVSNQKQCLPGIVAECQGIKAGRLQLTAGRKRCRGWGAGPTSSGADCGSGSMSGRLHPSLRLCGTTVQTMGDVYGLEKGRLAETQGGWKLPGSLTLHDLAPGFLGSS